MGFRTWWGLATNCEFIIAFVFRRARNDILPFYLTVAKTILRVKITQVAHFGVHQTIISLQDAKEEMWDITHLMTLRLTRIANMT